MESQADFSSYDPLAARLGCKAIKKHGRHVVMMYVNDQFRVVHSG
jgi:hypothetical protein